MQLFKAAQLISDNYELEDEHRELLTQAAEMFARSGLSSLSEWNSLSDEEQAALVVAQDRLASERALLFISGLADPALLTNKLDGGATETRCKLQSAVARAAERAKNKATV